ncbi:MAG: TnsD family transposase [Pyrinomonadaceae bacterium]|nr:TnsD family transposase [Pyrinomonadaceae bacterium]
MLGFFTDPFPDEILYSAAARYHHRAKNKRTSVTARDWFGEDAYRVVVDFPSHLDYLISALPKGHIYTADILIEKHTLFPFYVPFLPAGRAEKIREYLRSSVDGGAVYPLLGMLTSKITLNALRYCPLCAEEDRQQYGEAYWHRVHQIPGVFACAKHKLFLNDGYAHPRSVEDRNKHFVCAEEVINLSLIQPLDLTNADHKVHFQIAEDVEWLSKNNLNDLTLSDFNARYRYVLFNSRLLTFGGSLSLTKIKQKFTELFSAELLNETACLVKGKSTWIDRLFNNPDGTQHPVRHLLFLQFCNYSLEEFIKLPTKIKPFGKPPFPCLNPAAEHFQQPVIEKVHITNKQKSDTEISGTFYCECGFVYRKFGRDEKGKRRFEFDRVVQFGATWDNALKQIFEQGEPNLEEIAKKFGVVERTLLRQLVRLGLTNKYETLMPKRLGKARMSFEEIEEKRTAIREEWLKMLRENPKLSRSKLRWVNETVHSWLYKNDRIWLQENYPKLKTKQTKYKLVNWNDRDEETAPKIKDLADELKSLPGRPIFVSKTILYRRLKIANLLKRPQFVPKTIEALETYGETFEDYAIRRIDWGIEESVKKNKPINQFAFMKLTGVAPKCLANNPLVKGRFYEALEIIKSRVRNI